MGGLVTAQAPLRGRAGLELVVNSFDYRTAAGFWGLDHDPALAFRVFAVVEGTPAYAREFVGGDAPADVGDVEHWLGDRVLDPASPLFREGRVLLAEDPELATVRDRGLYYSVLAAVANGNRTTSRGYGRPSARRSSGPRSRRCAGPGRSASPAPTRLAARSSSLATLSSMTVPTARSIRSMSS